MPDLWYKRNLGGSDLALINIEHPSIHRRVMAEIDAGIDVYYDRRWEATERFGELLHRDPALVAGKRVLILGAGAGLEAIVIGKLCSKLYVNDLAPVSLELCAEQLDKNGIKNYETLPGCYETLDIPNVDLIVGCFIIYNRETRQAMAQVLDNATAPILLVNEELDVFRALIRQTDRRADYIEIDDGPTVVTLTQAAERVA